MLPPKSLNNINKYSTFAELVTFIIFSWKSSLLQKCVGNKVIPQL